MSRCAYSSLKCQSVCTDYSCRFANRDDLDFMSLPDNPTQTFSLPYPLSQSNDILELPVKRQLFQNVTSLTLFVENDWTDNDTSCLTFLGFRGDWTAVNRDPVVTLYESAANPKDHIIEGTTTTQIGQI